VALPFIRIGLSANQDPRGGTFSLSFRFLDQFRVYQGRATGIRQPFLEGESGFLFETGHKASRQGSGTSSPGSWELMQLMRWGQRVPRPGISSMGF